MKLKSRDRETKETWPDCGIVELMIKKTFLEYLSSGTQPFRDKSVLSSVRPARVCVMQ